jgi:cytochrome c2
VKYCTPLVILALLFHLPFVFVVMGGATLSIVFNLLDKKETNPRFRQLAQDLLGKALHPSWLLFLGVIPIVCISALQLQIYGSAPDKLMQWGVMLALIVLGFVLLLLYQYTFARRDVAFLLHIGCGIAGLFSLVHGYLLFIYNKGILLYPAMWEAMPNPLDFTSFLSFFPTFLPMFVLFALIGLAIGGGFMVGKFGSKKMVAAKGAEYTGFACKVGLYVALVFTALQPAVVFWHFTFLPRAAVSWPVLVVGLSIMVLGMLVCLCIYGALLRPGSFFEKLVVALLFLNVGAFVADDYVTRDAALYEQCQYVESKAVKAMPRPAGYNPVVQGQEIYEMKCMACHTMDGSPKVGPSFKGIFDRTETVLREGKEVEVIIDEAYVRRAILSPAADLVKGYQNLMTQQNLSEDELQEIIAYLQTAK